MSESRYLAPAQVRAARALLGWTQGELAMRAAIGKQTVVRFEGGGHAPISAVIEAIRATLETAGIEFIREGAVSAAGGVGVRLRVCSAAKEINSSNSDGSAS